MIMAGVARKRLIKIIKQVWYFDHAKQTIVARNVLKMREFLLQLTDGPKKYSFVKKALAEHFNYNSFFYEEPVLSKILSKLQNLPIGTIVGRISCSVGKRKKFVPRSKMHQTGFEWTQERRTFNCKAANPVKKFKIYISTFIPFFTL